MDLLTPTVNVPTERAKLRQIADEMRAEIAERNNYIKTHGIRAFQRRERAKRDIAALGKNGQHRPASMENLRMAPSQRT